LRCSRRSEASQTGEPSDRHEKVYGFVTPDDIRGGPLEARIINVYISEKHQVPVLELDSGDQFLAWPNNGRKLARAYGFNDKDWIGHLIRFELATYTNKDGETKETVNLTAVSSRDSNTSNGAPPRISPDKLPAPMTTTKDDMEDSVPF
jgi:hypothetical protein